MAAFRSLLIFTRGVGMTQFSTQSRHLVSKRTLATGISTLNRRFDEDWSRDDFSGGHQNQNYRKSGRWDLTSDEYSFGSRLVAKDWSSAKEPAQLPEPMEIPPSNMSSEEVQNFREENRISLLWNEESAPDPLTDFSVFPKFVSNILVGKAKFISPMPVQAQGWPIALKGLDLIAIGETGSGKTLGYLLPSIVHVHRKAPTSSHYRGQPSVLVLAPTRELAQQIDKVLRNYLKEAPGQLRSVCLTGGSAKALQLRRLDEGVDFVVATPGRLIDLLEMEALDLSNITYIVLDEADRMLDMGFEPQIRKVMGQIRPERQLSMWSATWPREVRELAEDFLSEASKERRGKHVHVNIGNIDLQANSDITQNVYVVKAFEKQDRLFRLVRDIMNSGDEDAKMLIFAQTKRTVDFLERLLYREGHKVISIHGGKTQNQRDNALEYFRHGRYNILIATDVAARGLDVNNIQHVINFDFPPTTEDYIHRIGRTGRSGNTGTSHSFFTEDDSSLAKELVSIMQRANQNVPEDLQEIANFRSSSQRKFNRYRNPSQGYRDGPQRYNRDFVRRRDSGQNFGHRY